MPFAAQFILGILAAASFVYCAVCSDRMARELRHTGEPRYSNPWVRPGRFTRGFSSDLGRNYRERFPERKRLPRASLISGIAGVLFLVFLRLTLTHPLPRHTELIETYNFQLAR